MVSIEFTYTTITGRSLTVEAEGSVCPPGQYEEGFSEFTLSIFEPLPSGHDLVVFEQDLLPTDLNRIEQTVTDMIADQQREQGLSA